MNRGASLMTFILIALPLAALLWFGLTQLDPLRLEMRDRARISDMKDIQNALALYAKANKHFPSTLEPIVITGDDPISRDLEGELAIPEMPTDPQYPTRTYIYKSDGQTYTIQFCLESEREPYHVGCKNKIEGALASR